MYRETGVYLINQSLPYIYHRIYSMQDMAEPPICTERLVFIWSIRVYHIFFMIYILCKTWQNHPYVQGDECLFDQSESTIYSSWDIFYARRGRTTHMYWETSVYLINQSLPYISHVIYSMQNMAEPPIGTEILVLIWSIRVYHIFLMGYTLCKTWQNHPYVQRD